MNFCPIKTLKAWTDLVDAVGETQASALWAAYQGSVPDSFYVKQDINTEILPSINKISSSNIKPGVSELFESNPELANAVYEALGFNIKGLTSTKDIIKAKLSSFYKENLFTTIRGEKYEVDFSQRFNAAKSEQESFLNGLQKYLSNTGIEIVDNTIEFLNTKVRELNSLRDSKQKEFEDIFNNSGFDYKIYYKELEDRLYGNKKDRKDYKTLTGFDNYLQNNPKEKELFKKLDKERTELLGNYGKLNSTEAAGEIIKQSLEKIENYIGGFKESDINFILPNYTITPEQKQQAQQQYSQYLDTKDTPIVYHGSPNYFEEFDESKKGSYTRAASAKEGIFFGSSVDVSKSYLDKKGKTLDVDAFIKQKYGNLKNFSKESIAFKGEIDIDLGDGYNVYEPFAVLNNGDVIGYRETGDTYIIGDVNTDSFIKNIKSTKNLSIDEIKNSIDKTKEKDADLYVKFIERDSHLKETYDDNYGGYIDKNRDITDKPFEDLFIRPFTLKLKNPLIVSDEGKSYREESYYERIKKAKELGHDGVIIKETFDSKFQTKPEDVYVVFNTNQIEFSGSKQDIESFANFIKNNNISNIEAMRKYMDSKSVDYIIDKLIQSGKIEKKC